MTGLIAVSHEIGVRAADGNRGPLILRLPRQALWRPAAFRKHHNAENVGSVSDETKSRF